MKNESDSLLTFPDRRIITDIGKHFEQTFHEAIDKDGQYKSVEGRFSWSSALRRAVFTAPYTVYGAEFILEEFKRGTAVMCILAPNRNRFGPTENATKETLIVKDHKGDLSLVLDMWAKLP